MDLEPLRNENKALRAQFKATEINEEEIDTEDLDKIDSEVEIESEETFEALEVCEENFVEKNNCNKCDFIGKNLAGLKIHDKAKYKGNILLKENPLMQRFQE